MKVLLVGEFSGIHNNLKVGLEHFGVDVTLMNLGDGYKGFSSDMPMRVAGESWRVKVENKLLEKYNLYKMQKYDVIQIMHPRAVNFYNHSMVCEVLDKAKLVVQMLAGCDYLCGKHYKKIDARLCESCLKYEQRNGHCLNRRAEEVNYQKSIFHRADVMVPMAWEYYYCASQELEYRKKLHKLIPMPLDLKSNRMTYAHNDKIQVFHPLNREGTKGTKVLRPIFSDLQKEYNEIADFRIEGQMPIDQYRKLLSQMDIVVDQLYSFPYGMNAVYAMAMGKAVFCGNAVPQMFEDNEWLRDMPVMSLGYSEEEIKENIMRAVKDNELDKLKLASRKYVEKYHDTVKVAKIFLKLYRQYL